jgi:hypothetical protein
LNAFLLARRKAAGPGAALASQGVALASGDILLLRTGWSGHYLRLGPDGQEAFRRGGMRAPGLGQSAEMVEYLWDHQVAMVASDNAGVEANPVNPDSGFVIPGEEAPERGPSHNPVAGQGNHPPPSAPRLFARGDAPDLPAWPPFPQ